MKWQAGPRMSWAGVYDKPGPAGSQVHAFQRGTRQLSETNHRAIANRSCRNKHFDTDRADPILSDAWPQNELNDANEHRSSVLGAMRCSYQPGRTDIMISFERIRCPEKQEIAVARPSFAFTASSACSERRRAGYPAVRAAPHSKVGHILSPTSNVQKIEKTATWTVHPWIKGRVLNVLSAFGAQAAAGSTT